MLCAFAASAKLLLSVVCTKSSPVIEVSSKITVLPFPLAGPCLWTSNGQYGVQSESCFVDYPSSEALTMA